MSPSPGNGGDNVEVLAEEIQHRTNLSDRECIVVAGDQIGLDDDEIASLIHRSKNTVDRTRSKLRKRRREIPDRIEELEATLDELEVYRG